MAFLQHIFVEHFLFVPYGDDVIYIRSFLCCTSLYGPHQEIARLSGNNSRPLSFGYTIMFLVFTFQLTYHNSTHLCHQHLLWCCFNGLCLCCKVTWLAHLCIQQGIAQILIKCHVESSEILLHSEGLNLDHGRSNFWNDETENSHEFNIDLIQEEFSPYLKINLNANMKVSTDGVVDLFI